MPILILNCFYAQLAMKLYVFAYLVAVRVDSCTSVSLLVEGNKCDCKILLRCK